MLQHHGAGCRDESAGLAGGDGVGQNFSHGGDGSTIFGAALLEAGKVVDKGKVHDRIAVGGTLAENVELFYGAAERLGAFLLELLSTLVAARETKNSVPMGEQIVHDGRADEARGASDEDAHCVMVEMGGKS